VVGAENVQRSVTNIVQISCQGKYFIWNFNSDQQLFAVHRVSSKHTWLYDVIKTWTMIICWECIDWWTKAFKI